MTNFALKILWDSRSISMNDKQRKFICKLAGVTYKEYAPEGYTEKPKKKKKKPDYSSLFKVEPTTSDKLINRVKEILGKKVW